MYDNNNAYQYVKIQLVTTNPTGYMKISARVEVFFGAANSYESLIYNYDNVDFNLLTRELRFENENDDLVMTAVLNDENISGDWFINVSGKLGTFVSLKNTAPEPEEGFNMLQSFTGKYDGSFENSTPATNLPARISMRLSAKRIDSNKEESPYKVNGELCFFYGHLDSVEYVELPFIDMEYDFFSRNFEARTDRYPFIVRGLVSPTGAINETLLNEEQEEIGTITAGKVSNLTQRGSRRPEGMNAAPVERETLR